MSLLLIVTNNSTKHSLSFISRKVLQAQKSVRHLIIFNNREMKHPSLGEREAVTFAQKAFSQSEQKRISKKGLPGEIREVSSEGYLTGRLVK